MTESPGWIAAKGVHPRDLMKKLRVGPGRADWEAIDAFDISCARLPSGWYLVIIVHDVVFPTNEEWFAELSSEGDVVRFLVSAEGAFPWPRDSMRARSAGSSGLTPTKKSGSVEHRRSASRPSARIDSPPSPPTMIPTPSVSGSSSMSVNPSRGSVTTGSKRSPSRSFITTSTNECTRHRARCKPVVTVRRATWRETLSGCVGCGLGHALHALRRLVERRDVCGGSTRTPPVVRRASDPAWIRPCRRGAPARVPWRWRSHRRSGW